MVHNRANFIRRAVQVGLSTGVVTVVALAPALAAHAAGGPVTVGMMPMSVGIDELNHRVFIANGAGRTVSVFDGTAATPTVTSVPLPGDIAGLAVDSATHRAFITLPTLGKVAVIDTSAPMPVMLYTIAVGTSPNSVAIDPSTHNVFVVNNGSASVSKFLGTDMTPAVQTITVGASPLGIALDTSTHTVLVASSATSSVARFDGSAPMPAVTQIAGVTNAGSIAVDSRSHRAFATNTVGNQVLRFSTIDTAPAVDAIPVGSHPVGITADPTIGEVYVTNQLDGTVSHFDGLAAVPVVATLMGAGLVPSAIAVDSTLPARTLYVTNRDAQQVTRLDGITPSSPIITSGPGPLPAATVGVPYSFAFTATGRPSVQFSNTLPLGSEFSIGTRSGILSGSPTVVGPITFTLNVTNGIDPVATQTFTLQVNAAPVTPIPTPTPTTPGTGGSGGTGAGGSGSGSGAGGSSGGGGLAHTGQSVEGIAPIGIAGLVLLVSGAVVAMKRRAKRA